MTTVWTQEADARLRDYLASHELVAGIGTEESACSVAAINLAITLVWDCLGSRGRPREQHPAGRRWGV